MDRLAAELGWTAELRSRNALREGSLLPTASPSADPSRRRSCSSASPRSRCRRQPPRHAPAAPSGHAGEGVCRAVGYAAGFKNVAFSEPSTIPQPLASAWSCRDGAAVLDVHCAAAESGRA